MAERHVGVGPEPAAPSRRPATRARGWRRRAGNGRRRPRTRPRSQLAAAASLLLGQRHDDTAGIVDPLRHLEAELAWDQGLEHAGHAVGARARPPPQLQHVAKTARRDQAGAGDLALEERVRRRGRAVDDGPRSAARRPPRASAASTPRAWIRRRGRHLGDTDRPGWPGSSSDQVGEGAADVDAHDPLPARRSPLPRAARARGSA